MVAVELPEEVLGPPKILEPPVAQNDSRARVKATDDARMDTPSFLQLLKLSICSFQGLGGRACTLRLIGF